MLLRLALVPPIVEDEGELVVEVPYGSLDVAEELAVAPVEAVAEWPLVLADDGEL